MMWLRVLSSHSLPAHALTEVARNQPATRLFALRASIKRLKR